MKTFKIILSTIFLAALTHCGPSNSSVAGVKSQPKATEKVGAGDATAETNTTTNSGGVSVQVTETKMETITEMVTETAPGQSITTTIINTSTVSGTVTNTATSSVTGTVTQTNTVTGTVTQTNTVTGTVTQTTSVTGTVTQTNTVTGTVTNTQTTTQTQTVTGTVTTTQSNTTTVTQTNTTTTTTTVTNTVTNTTTTTVQGVSVTYCPPGSVQVGSNLCAIANVTGIYGTGGLNGGYQGAQYDGRGSDCTSVCSRNGKTPSFAAIDDATCATLINSILPRNYSYGAPQPGVTGLGCHAFSNDGFTWVKGNNSLNLLIPSDFGALKANAQRACLCNK